MDGYSCCLSCTALSAHSLLRLPAEAKHRRAYAKGCATQVGVLRTVASYGEVAIKVFT